MNRTELNRLFAKCLAYKQCGQETKARLHFEQLAFELGYANNPALLAYETNALRINRVS